MPMARERDPPFSPLAARPARHHCLLFSIAANIYIPLTSTCNERVKSMRRRRHRMPLPTPLILLIFLVVCALLLRQGACADSEDSSSSSSTTAAIDGFKKHTSTRTIRENSTSTRKRRRSGKNGPGPIADGASQQQSVPNCTNKWSTFKRKLAARIESKRARKRARQLEGCQSQGEKLMDILREIVLEALQSDRSVHLTGHSQGAAIASLLALDIAINFHEVSISKLFLWTFGGPEVADSEFYASARQQAPRLDDFLNDRERYNRFVTRASNCGEDFVTNVASNSLNRRVNRRLGGVRGNIVHAAEPVHVPLMSKKSGLEGHFISNYLLGISIASPDQPLEASFSNNNMRVWMGGER